MKCPICDYSAATGVLRCPQCNEPLTVWLNLDHHAAQAHAAGLFALQQQRLPAACELMWRAVILAPTEVAYLTDCGKALALAGRYCEARFLLEKAGQLAPSPHLNAVLAKVESRLQSQQVSTMTPEEQSPPVAESACGEGDEETAGPMQS